MKIYLSFPIDSFNDTYDAFIFIDKYITFVKSGILTHKNKTGIIDYDIKKIETYFKINNSDSFNLVSNNSSTFDFGNSITYRRSVSKDLNIFICTVENSDCYNLEELISASKDKMFSTILIYDSIKSLWQNEKIIDNYKTLGKPYKHLPKIWDPVLSPLVGEVIDISVNPGHYIETYQMALMAGPEIWFGPNAWTYFDKGLILSFPHALSKAELIPNVVYIKLFNWNVLNYETEEILSLQKEFRTWTKMDEIEKDLNTKILKSTKLAFLTLDLKDQKKSSKLNRLRN